MCNDSYTGFKYPNVATQRVRLYANEDPNISPPIEMLSGTEAGWVDDRRMRERDVSTNKSHHDYDNSIGGLLDYLILSVTRLIKRALPQLSGEVLLHRHDRVPDARYLTLFIDEMVLQVNFNDSTPQLYIISCDNVSLREYFSNRSKVIDNLNRYVEEDLKDYAIAIGKLTEAEQNRLFVKWRGDDT